MHLFTSNYNQRKSHIKKYNCIKEIIDEFFEIRWEAYMHRKESYLQTLEKELIFLENKIRFMSCIMKDEIILHKKISR